MTRFFGAEFIEKIYPYYKKYRLPVNDPCLIDCEERAEFSWFCKENGADFNCNITMEDAIELENKYRTENNITPLITPIKDRKPF